MNRFERWSVWGTSVLVALSGSGYLWTKYFLEPPGPFAVVNHPLEPWFLRIHVLSAPFFVFAMGLITVKHVWKHYRSGVRWGRKSGLASILTLIPMVLSGYLIQVMTARGWLTAMAVAHIVVSFLFLAALGAHQWAVSRTEPRPRWPESRRGSGRRRGHADGRHGDDGRAPSPRVRSSSDASARSPTGGSPASVNGAGEPPSTSDTPPARAGSPSSASGTPSSG